MSTDYSLTHPYRYQVWYTTAGQPETSKDMAFTTAQDLASIQARNTEITVTRIEVAGATR